MTKRTLLGAAMPFAHLLGLSARAEEDDEKSKRAKSRRAEDDDKDESDAEDEDDEPKSRKAKGKADDGQDDDPDKDDPDAEVDEDDPEDKPKQRKAKGRADDADPDAEDEDDDKPKSAAVVADRRRCAAIVAHGLTLGSVEQACIFAFDTNMSQASAIAALSAASGASARKGGLRERMDSNRVKPVGDDDGGKTPSGMTDTASAIVRAAERAQGKH